MLPEERRKRSGLVGEPETQGERPRSCARMLSVLEQQPSELAELPFVFVSTLAVFGERPSAWGRMLHPFGPMPTHSEGHLGQHRPLLHELAATPWKKHGQLYPEKAIPYANLGTPYSKLGMPSRFAGTPCEGEDEIREESRDPRALLRVPDPCRKRRRRREERPSPRKATLRAHLGTPSMRFETPNDERAMPAVKLRSPRRHPPSLQRFSREELAPFTTEGLFSTDARSSYT
jgi:hypothetical protein